MGKYFPKLTQKEVFIQTDEDGGGFNCPMLPVSALNEMNECSVALQNCKTIEAFENVRQRLLALVRSVFPAELHDALNRFDIPKLTELVAYLMFGDPENDDQPKKEGKAAEKN